MNAIPAAADIEATDLRTLVSHACFINGGQKLESVYEEFQKHEHEFMAVLDDEQRVLGICSREELGMLLSIRYGRELFARKAVRDHLSRPATVVTVGARVSSVLHNALSREDRYFFEDVVLIEEDRTFCGLIAVQTLIRLQHRLLTATILGLESQSRQITARQRELEEDLRLASSLQQAMFHSQLHRTSSVGFSRRYRLYYRYLPASMVGGDYFHAFEPAEGTVGIMVCDVMGHGVRSALVTAMLRALTETHLPTAEDPGAFLTSINRDLTSLLCKADDSLFVTAQYLLVDTVRWEVRQAIAGHHPPLLLRKNCEPVPLCGGADLSGPPLGILEDVAYPTGTTPLDVGDLLLLYTDGLFEVFSPAGEMYGQQRLVATIGECTGLPVPAIFSTVFERLGEFAGEKGLTDDICIVALSICPDARGNVSNTRPDDYGFIN